MILTDSRMWRNGKAIMKHWAGQDLTKKLSRRHRIRKKFLKNLISQVG